MNGSADVQVFGAVAHVRVVKFPDAGHYDESLNDTSAKLVFRADYKLHVIVDSGSGISASADGSTSLRYVEYPNDNAEKRTKQTTLGDGSLRFDSKTGRFCYSITMDGKEYTAGSCQLPGPSTSSRGPNVPIHVP
jgi:hypothetical protein